MPKLDLHTAEGVKKRGKIDLAASVFEAPVRESLMHAEVRRQLARRRSGTHATRNRSAASGGGAKPYRQKGTGHARQGTRRAPQFAGGGVVFGPVPRSYAHSLPKKMRASALRAALSLRQREGAISVVDSLELSEFSTKRVIAILRALGFERTSVLIVIEGPDEKLEKSTRNIAWACSVRVAGLNVYDVLRSERLLFTVPALAAVEARLGGAVQGGASEGVA